MNDQNAVKDLPTEALLTEIARRLHVALDSAPPIDESQSDQGPTVTLSMANAAFNTAADMVAKTKTFYGIEV